MKISKDWLLVAGVVASALVLIGTRVLADAAKTIDYYAPGSAGITYDGNGDFSSGGNNNDVIVDNIMSQPGVFGGKTYTSWAILAADASGSIDVFGYTSVPTSWPTGYTPAVGDQISVTGTWSPYHGIPELASPTSVTVGSQGNAQMVGSKATTIANVLANNGTTTAGPFAQNLEGYLVEIPNVTISGQGTVVNWPATNSGTTALPNLYLNDSGGGKLTLYFWYSSYSCDGQMVGAPIPNYAVDVYGLLTAYPSVKSGVTNWQDELIPTAFVQEIPEPSSFMLAGVGLLSLLAALRRRHS
jgi:hypothetical protein